ncbi:uncharacterized protein [Battus philenor]|uniref:uncharacterized protein n=1 Tax=Battus philenor TaxID=42288 RepID=UPI0035D11FB3
MPANSVDFFHMQDAKNNFNAMRPAPVCSDATNQSSGHCQNVYISRNCYYGYQETKTPENFHKNTDCEMRDVTETASTQKNGKKRCADFCVFPKSKRLREEVQKKNIEPEITENSRLDTGAEDLLENLYWNLHGGHMFHLYCVCD